MTENPQDLLTSKSRTLAGHPAELMRIPVHTILEKEGFNPRLNLGNLDELKSSILELGQTTPIVISADYNIVSGHRRTAAIRELHRAQMHNGIVTVLRLPPLPEFSLLIIAMTENSDARSGLSYLDIATACERMPGWSAAKLAAITGFKKHTIVRARLFKDSPAELCTLIQQDHVSQTAALAWLRLTDEIKAEFPVTKLVGLSAEDVRKLAKELAKSDDQDEDDGDGDDQGDDQDEDQGPTRPSRKDIMQAIADILHAAPDAGFNLDSNDTADYARVSVLAYAAGYNVNPVSGVATKKLLAELKTATRPK